METPGSAAEETEEDVRKKISESFFYDYMEMVSMPFVTPESDIPLELIILVYPLQLHMHTWHFSFLGQGLANYSPMDQIWPPTCFPK